MLRGRSLITLHKKKQIFRPPRPLLQIFHQTNFLFDLLYVSDYTWELADGTQPYSQL